MRELTWEETSSIDGGWVRGVAVGVIANAVYDAGKAYFNAAKNMDMAEFGKYEAARTGNKTI